MASVDNILIDLDETLNQEVSNIGNRANAFEEDIEKDDQVKNVYQRYRDADKPPLMMLSFSSINEVILMDTGAAFSFLSEALFQ